MCKACFSVCHLQVTNSRQLFQSLVSMKTAIAAVMFFFISYYTWSQGQVDQVLGNIYMDSAGIKDQAIRSAHVFLEIMGDNYEGGGTHVIAAKRMEIEFDEMGMPVYQRYNYLTGEWSVLGEKESMYHSVIYDKNHRIARNCLKAKWQSYCQFYTYNVHGNNTSIRYEGQSVPNGLWTFEWKDGKMIRATGTAPGKDLYYESKYDKQGRVVEIPQANGRRMVYSYRDNGKEETTIAQSYVKDSLLSKYVISTIKKTRQMTYFCNQNGRLDTLVELKAVYDEFNNLTSIYHAKYKERDQDGHQEELAPETVEGSNSGNNPETITKKVPAPEIDTYTIKNIYENGLLIKRLIYIKRNNYKRDNEPDMIERIIYEKEPLASKFWPSDE